MVLVVDTSLKLVRYLSNVHTCAIFFLRHLANTYVQRGPLLSVNWLRLCPQSGARVRSHGIQRRLFIVLMTAAHDSPNVFSLRNFLGNIHVLFSLYIHHHSYLLYITFKQAFTSFYYMIKSLFHFFGSSWQAGCPRCLVSDTARVTISSYQHCLISPVAFAMRKWDISHLPVMPRASPFAFENQEAQHIKPIRKTKRWKLMLVCQRSLVTIKWKL